MTKETGMKLAVIAASLVRQMRHLRFDAPVACVYNPWEYAMGPYRRYVERFGRRRREVILLGMNPGPWGMAQTGIPFGEVNAAKSWLEVEAPVGRPRRVHPRRPVEGFACGRSEVSGARLWGWARETFQTPRRFFERFFVVNYCPLCFMEDSGRNRTPDKLPAHEREPLFRACDRALRQTVEFLSPRVVVGVGKFAETRAKLALEGFDVLVGRILHPSPASPAANRDWASQANRQLEALGIALPLRPAGTVVKEVQPPVAKQPVRRRRRGQAMTEVPHG